jgi:hypothetical protein
VEHPEATEFEAFVIGALDDARRTAFLAHVDGCDACSAKLEAEAKAELAILEVHEAAKEAPKKKQAPSAAGANVRRIPIRGVAAVTAVLVVAASLFFYIRSKRNEGASTSSTAPMTMTVTTAATTAPAEAPIPPVVCLDGEGQEKCIDDAHQHGLVVKYPPWAKGPLFGGGPSGRGPNGSPFAPPSM